MRKQLLEASREILRALLGADCTDNAAPLNAARTVDAGSMPALRLILLAALLLRLLWWSTYPLVISNEGSVYARLAQNLFAGSGYVDTFGGPHVLFPPLYPILIGIAGWFAGSEEVAGQLVSLISGVALVGVVYLLTDRVFTRRVAILAGVLAACHPLLIAMSVMVYTESLFVFLILAGAYYALDCLRNPSIAPAVASGTLFGMAYLTRPEGIAYAMLFAGLLGIHAFWARGGAWSMAKQATAIVVLAGLMAAPYVAHLSSLAGGFRWEGKSWMNNIQSERMAAGLSHAEAKRGLVEGLNGRLTLAVDEGDQLRHLRQPSARVGSLSDSLLTSPGENVLRIGKTIFSTLAIGSPAIMLLALLGIAGTRWWRHRFWEGGALLAILGLQLLILMSLQFTWERFLWPMVPVLVIWTAGGVNCMAGLIVGALPQTFSPRGRDTVVGLINCAMIAAIALIALWGVVRAGAERDRLAKEAGEWIREDFARTNPAGRRPVVMGCASSGTLVHYANANLKFLPYAEEPKALQYVRQNPPDYIVVRDQDATVDPNLANWLERGPADPCAVLAHSWSSKNTRLKIWRWHCSR